MARRDIIVIGASAGGIGVLETILSALPWDFEASLFLVLHTAEESPALLPQILNRSSKLAVLYAVDNVPILRSRVHVAPAGSRHMLLGARENTAPAWPARKPQPAGDRCAVSLGLARLWITGDWGCADRKSR